MNTDPFLEDLGMESLVPLNADDAFFPLALDDLDGDKSLFNDDLLRDLGVGTGEASPASTRIFGVSGGSGVSPDSSNMTPAASESNWNAKSNRHLSGGTSSAPTTNTIPSVLLTPSEEEEQKRQARMKKNRENAHLSRIRKKQQLENLEAACQSLADQNTELNVFVQRLAAENFLLRDHLKEVCGRAKVAMPEVPSVLEEMGGDVEGGVGSTPWVKTDPQGPEDPSSSLSRPTRAAAAKRKRGGTSSGATAAFLALFSLFLFASPSAFIGGEGDNPSSSAVAGLPAVSSVATGLVHAHAGRGLMSIDEEGTDATNILSVSDYFAQTVEALLVDQAPLDLPNHALAVAKDLAPSALALDVENQREVPGKKDAYPLPASSVFPALADRFFSSSGLEAPRMCKKVFEFTPEDVKTSQRNKKSIERYVMGTTAGFKGRATGLKITDGLSEKDSEKMDQKTADGLREKKAEKKAGDIQTALKALQPLDSTIEPDKEPILDADHSLPAEQQPSIVSVLLPTNASDSTPGLTAINELYVVILNPQSTFTTYACQLPNKGALVV